jgi:hypothetical protein
MSTTLQYQRLEAVQDELYQTAGYRAAADTSLAARRETALTRLIDMLPQSGVFGGAGGEQVRFDMAVLRQQLADVQKWLSTRRGAANQVIYTDASYYRE